MRLVIKMDQILRIQPGKREELHNHYLRINQKGMEMSQRRLVLLNVNENETDSKPLYDWPSEIQDKFDPVNQGLNKWDQLSEDERNACIADVNKLFALLDCICQLSRMSLQKKQPRQLLKRGESSEFVPIVGLFFTNLEFMILHMSNAGMLGRNTCKWN
jgi:hypothetical protein